jgi:hypothetical protein
MTPLREETVGFFAMVTVIEPLPLPDDCERLIQSASADTVHSTVHWMLTVALSLASVKEKDCRLISPLP